MIERNIFLKDICVANRKIEGKQHTVTWRVIDLKSSHVDPKVNDKFQVWCEKVYGSDALMEYTSKC